MASYSMSEKKAKVLIDSDTLRFKAMNRHGR
jgi:hypothetical protein